MDLYEKYLNSSFHFLSFRARSEKEVRDNLQKKNASQEIIDKVIEFLKEQKFINDEDFATQWVEQRQKFRPRSKAALKMELLRKGIGKETIEKVFSQANEGDEINDVEEAKKLVRKRIERLHGLPKQEIYQKLAGFLQRRGFGWETIRQSIDDILKLEYNE